MLIANSDGLLAGDDQARTRFSVSCVAIGDTGMQTGYETVGPHRWASSCSTRCRSRTWPARRPRGRWPSCRPARRPPGELPVVLAGGSGGILFHEACGHGLEADHIVKDASVYTGQVGQLVASPLVTLVDDGTVAREWGNFAVDDEGRPAPRNVLIENGVLTDYLWDWLRARKEGRESSGNGRRQSYQHLPMVRMTNTYLLAGDRRRRRDRGADAHGRLRGQARRRPGEHGHRRLRVRHHRGLPDRGRPDHRAAARRQPDRQRARGAAAHRRRGHRLRHDAGHLRQGRAERARSGCGQATMRITGVTIGGTADVSDLARPGRRRSPPRAAPGEEVEVYVARGTETEVRAYDGEVESLTSADLGRHRHPGAVDDGDGSRLGFAWAGSLDRVGPRRAPWPRPGTTRAFATARPRRASWPVPDGVAAVAVDLWDDGLAATCRPTTKSRWPSTSRPGPRAADPRIRQVSSADYGDSGCRVGAGLDHRHPLVDAGKTSGFLSVERHRRRGRRQPDRRRLQRRPGLRAASTRTEATDDAVTPGRPAARRHQGPVRAARTVVFDRRMATTLLSVVVLGPVGRGRGQGPVLLRRPDRASRSATPRLTLVDDPTDPRAYGAAAYDAEGLACRRNVLIDVGRAARVPLRHGVGSPGRGGLHRLGRAGRLRRHARSPGCRALTLAPGPEGYDEDGILAAVGEGLFVQSVTGVHSGVNPISGDFSVGAEGLMIRDGRLAEPVREITVASTLQRMLQSLVEVGADVEWLPGIAAGQTLAIGDMQISGV